MVKVLFVDDQELARVSMEALLSGYSFEVATAASGKEAISAASGFKPDVLITDWILGGGMNGIEVAKALREVAPGIRTVVISGNADAELRSLVREMSQTDLLEKPFDFEQLRTLVERGRANS